VSGIGGATDVSGIGGATDVSGIGGATDVSGIGGATDVSGIGGATDVSGNGCVSEEELEHIGSLGDECRAVRFGVDSGAATTIVKSDVSRGYAMNTQESRQYMAANKTTLTTEGTVALECNDGARVRAQVGEVSKNLMCVAEMCDAGFDVLFSNTKGYKATHGKTGAVLAFERVGKVFDLTLMVKQEPTAPSFRRQGGRP
jgi:hypothetical protein